MLQSLILQEQNLFWEKLSDFEYFKILSVHEDPFSTETYRSRKKWSIFKCVQKAKYEDVQSWFLIKFLFSFLRLFISNISQHTACIQFFMEGTNYTVSHKVWHIILRQLDQIFVTLSQNYFNLVISTREYS